MSFGRLSDALDGASDFAALAFVPLVRFAPSTRPVPTWIPTIVWWRRHNPSLCLQLATGISADRGALPLANIQNMLCQHSSNCYRFLVGGPSMGFKRKSSRVEVGKSGQLHRGSFAATCRVVNLSENGMRIQSRMLVKSGETLVLSIDLVAGRHLTCEIQVINVRPPHFGATIVSISPQDRERLAHILDDHVQSSFLRG